MNMKKFFISAAILALLSSSALSQDASPDSTSSTKLEKFISKKGILLIRDAHSPKAIDGPENDFSFVSFTGVAVYEPGKESSKVKGLRCSIYRAGGRSAASQSRVCFIDLEEAESLSSALQYLADLQDKVLQTPVVGMDERQSSFETTDGLNVGFRALEGVSFPNTRVTIGNIGAVSIEWKDNQHLSQMKAAVDENIEWLKKQ